MKYTKILIVDDEKYEAALIEKCVDWTKEGFELVGSAQTAASALELFAARVPDIVFCDINMPVMNGLEMSRRMKEERKEVCIIIVTGYREFEYARQALELGAQNYILKPIQPEELLRSAQKARQELHRECEPCVEGVTEDMVKNSQQKSTLTLEVLRYIEEHLSEPGLSLKEIAPAVFVSNSHLSRIFKSEMGENLTEYIVRRRMERSKELFDTTDLRVSEVAWKVGMTNPHYLGRCFKSYMGMTINEYRKKDRE